MDTIISLRPRQFSMFKTRAKQLLGSSHFTKRPGKMGAQGFLICVRAVGHVPLPMGPNLLYWINFRCISREPISYNLSVFPKKRFYGLASMNLATIPYQYDWSPLMTYQVFQEIDHIMSFDVVSMHTDIEPKMLSFGRYRKNRNGRNLISAVAVPEQRRTANRCPGTADIRYEQKSAFVQQIQMGTKSSGFFLYGATFSSSNLRWPSRLAPMPVVLVSDNSIPVLSVAASRLLPGYNGHGNSSGLTGQYASESRVPWDNLPALLLATTAVSNPPSEYRPTCKVVPKEIGYVALLRLFFGTLVPILQQNLMTLSTCLILFENFFQISARLRNMFNKFFHFFSPCKN